MLEELNAATRQLDHALQRYSKACSSFENCTISQLLLNRLSDELLMATSYETRMRQVKSVLSRTMVNPHPLVAPPLTTINSLPPEILCCIFQLVTSEEDCIGEIIGDEEDEEFPKYPELLSHVCSRWRQILISRGSFWSHIDLVPFHRFSRGLIARARAYVSRVTPLTLSVHIVNPVHKNRIPFDRSDFIQFLGSVAPQTRTLELEICRDDMDFHRLILETCFSSLVPGILEDVTIYDANAGEATVHTLIESAENPHSFTSMLLDVPHQRMEEVWHSIAFLNLTGFYPRWTSKAYHGLVELFLIAAGSISTPPLPTETQFTNILLSSPGLRSLRFELELIDWRPQGDSIAPVQLVDLEYLGFATSHFDQVGSILRLIAPGSKPLEVSVELLRNSESPTPFFAGEARRFFARSNVRDFFMSGSSEYQWANTVLGVLPSLENLCLDNFVGDKDFAPYHAPNNQNTPAAYRRFNNLRILFSTIQLNVLRRIIQKHMVQTLKLHCCTIHLNGRPISMREVKRRLADTGVVLKP